MCRNPSSKVARLQPATLPKQKFFHRYFSIDFTNFSENLFEGRFRQFFYFFKQQLVFISGEPTLTILEESYQIFVTRSLIRFSISGIIIHSIKLSEIVRYLLNGLPRIHKPALCRGSDHLLASSHLVRLNIFEIVRYNNNYALKLKCVT